MSDGPTVPRRELAHAHHLVPESYLLRFSDDGKVLMTDKVTARREAVAPRVLMTRRDYYMLETLEGPTDEVEKWLGQLEGTTLEILRRIEAGRFPPTADDRAILGAFIAFQLCRGPEFHELLTKAASAGTEMSLLGLTTHALAMREAIRATQGIEPTEQQVREAQESLGEAQAQGRISTTVPRPMAVMEMVEVGPVLGALLAKRSWDLYETRLPSFVTTDFPVAMWSPPLPNGRPAPVGVATAKEITFPLDSRRCLMLGQPGTGEGRYLIPDDSEGGQGVQLLNERHYLYARRFTFQHPHHDFTFDEVAAAQPTANA